ncbi:hypothetical protein [Pyxidicoccus xibeiensis]|nr:hypothetical protein [Pyxidicoccus xibeiensis]MCP3138429.1 hypothetical protein [Pyxidicoccus xibeiensis]
MTHFKWTGQGRRRKLEAFIDDLRTVARLIHDRGAEDVSRGFFSDSVT